MTPISTSISVVERIKVLNERLQKEKRHIKPIRIMRAKKIQDINERLQLNWDRLYGFYPELSNIKDIETFANLLRDGAIPNRMRLETVNSKIYSVGSKEWKDFLDSRSIS